MCRCIFRAGGGPRFSLTLCQPYSALIGVAIFDKVSANSLQANLDFAQSFVIGFRKRHRFTKEFFKIIDFRRVHHFGGALNFDILPDCDTLIGWAILIKFLAIVINGVD